MEPTLHEQSPLNTEGCHQEVEAHCAEAVPLQEGHEEAEPDKDHDVHVLEAWEGGHIHEPLLLVNTVTQSGKVGLAI